LLSFTFFIISSLSFWQKRIALSIPRLRALFQQQHLPGLDRSAAQLNGFAFGQTDQ